MLQATDDRSKIEKRVAVCTASEELNQLLERLLTSWGFSICSQDEPSALLLTEDGVAEPCAGQVVVCLDSSQVKERDQLGLQIRIDLLWQRLEQHFHNPPRMHMRKAVDLPARVSMRGEWHTTRLSSLSDMGTRFSSDREMVKQEPITIELAVGSVLLQYQGQIIFSMEVLSGEVQVFQSGVVFHKQGDAIRDDLRHYLIRQYLETVREGMELQDFQSGLAFFDLAPEVKHALLELD